MDPFLRRTIPTLIKTYALKRGHFVLKSGKTSSFYIDCRLLTLHHAGAYHIAQAFKEVLLDHFPETTAIGGPTLGADPIIGSILATAHTYPFPLELKGFLVRPTPKDHGTNRLVEGPLDFSDRVMVLEDVCTTGQSALHAIQQVQPLVSQVLGVSCLFDRQEGAQALFEQHKIPFYPLFTLSDLDLSL
jgi:orotate phosphoribosyltransferase